MGEVGEVVVDQLVVGLIVHMAGPQGPRRIVEAYGRRDQPFVGLLRIAHPDPDPAVLGHHRIGAHAGRGGDHLLAGNLGAAAGPVEPQAVVHAAQLVALDPAQGQRREAVAAAVGHGDHAARGRAVDHHRLIDDGPRDGLLWRQIVIPGGDVPAIADEHRQGLHIEHGSIARAAPGCNRNPQRPRLRSSLGRLALARRRSSDSCARSSAVNPSSKASLRS